MGELEDAKQQAAEQLLALALAKAGGTRVEATDDSPDRRVGQERRSGVEPRVSLGPALTFQRRGQERRTGVDRRQRAS